MNTIYSRTQFEEMQSNVSSVSYIKLFSREIPMENDLVVDFVNRNQRNAINVGKQYRK